MKDVNTRKNMKQMVWLFVVIFGLLIAYIFYAIFTFGNRWFVTPYNPRLAQAMSKVSAGAIYDRNEYRLAYTSDGERKYAKNSEVRLALSHTVGDAYGLTRGAETFFARELYGFNDNITDRFSQLSTGSERKGNDVYLTLDAELSSYIAGKLGKKKGAAVVMNYETGEVLASVSTPGFDPLKLEDFKEDDNSTQLFNRATMGRYPPGSTFKIITASAVIDNPEKSIGTVTCEGSVEIDGRPVSCAGGTAHGEVNLKSAFTKSCNVFFAQQAVRLGPSLLTQKAEKFGYNFDFMFNDLILYESEFTKPGSDVDTALAGIGQYKDLVTPLHSAMIAGAVANGGVMMEPKTLLKEVSPSGTTLSSLKSEVFSTPLSAGTAEEIKKMMIEAVEKGTGTNAYLKKHVVGGKTGTAQYMYDGEMGEHAWFVGFVANEDGSHPLSVSVLVEGGGSGGKVAAPIAKAAIVKAIELGY